MRSKKPARRKEPYQPPRDRKEKLELLGTMGYISANQDLLTYQWRGQLARGGHFSL